MDRSVDYFETLIERLKDKEEAESFLNSALEEYQFDGDDKALILALKCLLKAQNLSEAAKETTVSRQQIYKIIEGKSKNPKLQTIASLLNTLGFQLCVKPINEAS